MYCSHSSVTSQVYTKADTYDVLVVRFLRYLGIGLVRGDDLTWKCEGQSTSSCYRCSDTWKWTDGKPFTLRKFKSYTLKQSSHGCGKIGASGSYGTACGNMGHFLFEKGKSSIRSGQQREWTSAHRSYSCCLRFIRIINNIDNDTY